MISPGVNSVTIMVSPGVNSVTIAVDRPDERETIVIELYRWPRHRQPLFAGAWIHHWRAAGEAVCQHSPSGYCEPEELKYCREWEIRAAQLIFSNLEIVQAILRKEGFPVHFLADQEEIESAIFWLENTPAGPEVE